MQQHAYLHVHYVPCRHKGRYVCVRVCVKDTAAAGLAGTCRPPWRWDVSTWSHPARFLHGDRQTERLDVQTVPEHHPEHIVIDPKRKQTHEDSDQINLSLWKNWNHEETFHAKKSEKSRSSPYFRGWKTCSVSYLNEVNISSLRKWYGNLLLCFYI